MKPTAILRLASGLALLQYLGHSLLFLLKSPAHGPEELAVIDTMKAHSFDFTGFRRSYWEFYFGYGLLAILTGVIEVVLLWQLAALARTEAPRLRPLIALVFFFNLAHALLGLRYFFLTPVLADLVVALVVAWAFLSARPEGSPAAVRGRSA